VVFGRFLRNLIGPETIQKIVDYIDALGTPAFAVYGMQLADSAGLPLIAIVFVGVSNGVAGGLLRDIVVRDVPALLRPGQFASLTLLAACGANLLLTREMEITGRHAAWMTVAGFFVVRVLTIRFNWQTRSVWEGEE
jgi:uncharacterized membrane protein YeiH